MRGFLGYRTAGRLTRLQAKIKQIGLHRYPLLLPSHDPASSSNNATIPTIYDSGTLATIPARLCQGSGCQEASRRNLFSGAIEVQAIGKDEAGADQGSMEQERGMEVPSVLWICQHYKACLPRSLLGISCLCGILCLRKVCHVKIKLYKLLEVFQNGPDRGDQVGNQERINLRQVSSEEMEKVKILGPDV